MFESNLRRIAIPAIALCVAVAAYAQPVADRPKIVVGDAWEFTKRVAPSGRTEPVSRSVEAVLGDDRLLTRGTAGTVAEFDGAMEWMPEGNPDFRRRLVAFPLAVGNEWSVARKFANPNYSETGKARVAAVEQVTVPAGTFQCYRIEAEALMVGKYTSPNKDIKVDKDYSETRLWKRWYCPKVKWIAKEVLETRYFHPTNVAASNTVVETLELTRFTPGR